MDSGGTATTMTLKVCVAVAGNGSAESVTFRVTEKVPAALGVPVMTPAALSERPLGRAPEATDQVYGEVPPVAARVVAV